MEKKQVDLQIKMKYLEQIVNGAKVEDYRTLSRYNMGLLTHFTKPKTWAIRHDITHVRFVSGFRAERKFAICEIEGIFAEQFVNFIPEGMKPGTKALTIKIRRVLEHNL